MKIILTISLLCSMMLCSGCFLRLTNDSLKIEAASSYHAEAEETAEEVE